MATKTQRPRFAEDIAFIFSECNRIMGMGRDVFKNLPKEDVFFDLPHPSGGGRMLCGREAYKRIEMLAKEVGHRANLARRVTHETLRNPTKKLLVRRFVTEKRELDQKQIDRFLAAAGRNARAECADLTHFIPCYLMTVQEPEALKVGPVVFRNRLNFRRRILPYLRRYGDEFMPEKRKFARWLMAGAMAFYREFDWVAEVTIQNCDAKTSAIIAERAVTSALDCLHLIFRAQYSDKMRVGGPPLRVDRRTALTLRKDGVLWAQGSESGMGQVNFPEGWSSQLSDPEITFLLTLCGKTLEAAVDPDLARPLSRRFLDAAQWFGEASRDDRPATRVVKYVTALERMVMTDEKNDIASLVSERVAALCCDRSNPSDRQKWREDARRIYDLRSRLVHGSMSPSDTEIESGVWMAAHLAEHTLLSALSAFGTEGLTAETVSTKRLADWYSRVIAAVDAAHQHKD